MAALAAAIKIENNQRSAERRSSRNCQFISQIHREKRFISVIFVL